KQEIDMIRESCKIATEVMEAVKKKIKAGRTEEHIANEITKLFYKYNAEPAFKPIVASGVNSSYPHHVSSTRKIQDNDIVIIDLGCKYKSYCSDLTRTIFLGKINENFIKVCNAVKCAYKKSLKALKDGIKAKLIDKIARGTALKHCSAFRNAEYLHNTGHGIGLEVHELPRLNKYDNTVLKSGMVVTVEPGLYLQNSFGVRYENTLLITENGCEILT
ncbi:MAG: M24 family metallopeptidase, partial [Elusimicrobiota bacterium]|nr:M24 family metallopeptidase [Elusimicrobiota bacterium]